MTADDLLAYSAACGLFARLFGAGLDHDLVRRCAQGHVAEAWPFRDAGGGLAMLAGVFADLTDETLDMIERDNTVLFIGPENPVPMWESVWTTRDRLLFADCTEAVRQAFAGAGLTAPNDGREPADHLAFELSFLAALLARAGQAMEAGDEAQAQRHVDVAAAFFAAHPARWASDCLAEVGQRAATDFYRGAALLCADTLAGLQAAFAPVN
jgi:TorA maturation chaperone TorD